MSPDAPDVRETLHELVAPVGPNVGPDLDYYEAVPYLLVMESIEHGGEWLRRAAYPELPGCVAEAPSALEAFEKVERARLRVLRELWDRGAAIPVPRPPLRRCRPGPETPAARSIT